MYRVDTFINFCPKQFLFLIRLQKSIMFFNIREIIVIHFGG